ncbi:hypothetical protein [Streptomyces sp. NRRL WC-3742]|uniref:hypothetical protein n=1 Tax=Streptomyces sp. NRRL WC-3742 TaxID=1463934 RepID=UPI0004C7B7CD|nr:hypothetical protein [Streptomyces sp. NRRL WC-3742]
MPPSARRLAAAAAALFVLPSLVLLAGFGGAVLWDVILAVQFLSAAACAAPLFFPSHDRFRVACAAAGAIIACLWTPLLIIGFAATAISGVLPWVGAYLAIVLAAVAALIGAFQRAKGPGVGRPAVVVGWTAAALAVADWLYVAGPALLA